MTRIFRLCDVFTKTDGKKTDKIEVGSLHMHTGIQPMAILPTTKYIQRTQVMICDLPRPQWIRTRLTCDQTLGPIYSYLTRTAGQQKQSAPDWVPVATQYIVPCSTRTITIATGHALREVGQQELMGCSGPGDYETTYD